MIETARPAAFIERNFMDKEKAIKLAKQHFSDILKTKPEERTSSMREAAKFWELVVEALEKNEKSGQA